MYSLQKPRISYWRWMIFISNLFTNWVRFKMHGGSYENIEYHIRYGYFSLPIGSAIEFTSKWICADRYSIKYYDRDQRFLKRVNSKVEFISKWVSTNRQHKKNYIQNEQFSAEHHSVIHYTSKWMCEAHGSIEYTSEMIDFQEIFMQQLHSFWSGCI